MTTPRNSPPTHLRSHDRRSARGLSLIEHTITTMILEDLGSALNLAADAKSERSMALSCRITGYLYEALKSKWRSQHAKPDVLPYDDEKLPPEKRQPIAEQLQSLLGPAFAELVSEGTTAGREIVWAVMLTDIVLNEIGQDLLDSPVVYAADIARAVDRVSAYLHEIVVARHAPGESALLQASSDILHLIIQEACSYYLVKEGSDRNTQRCSFQVLEVTEDRIASFPREVAAFVSEKSRRDGPKQYLHLICPVKLVEGVYVLYGTYDDVRIFWSGPFIPQTKDNYVFFHPQNERALDDAGTIWVLCDWIDETVSIGFGQGEAEERIHLSDLIEEGQETIFICQLDIAKSING